MTFDEAMTAAITWAPRGAAIGADEVTLMVGFRDGLHAARLRAITIAGDAWLFILADIADASAISALGALRLNHAIAVGALVHQDDRLVLRHALRLATLDAATLIQTTTLVAHEAARLGARLAARTLAPTAILTWLAL